MLDNETTQPSKFGIKKWTEINNKTRRRSKTNRQIKFKTTMSKSSLCNWSDAYILVKGTTTDAKTALDDADVNGTNENNEN